MDLTNVLNSRIEVAEVTFLKIPEVTFPAKDVFEKRSAREKGDKRAKV
jgi:hypothetical protein